MADGDGGILRQKQQGHGLSHDVAAAHHHTVFPGGGDAIRPQQGHDPGGGAGQEPGQPQHQATHILRVEGVHVLLRADGLQHGPAVQPLRQRQLHQDPVHVLPAVHVLHQRQQLLLGGFGGQMVVQAPHPALGAVFLLVADVYGAGGVVPHQDHRQTRLAGQGGGLLPQPLPHPDGQGLAV